MIGAVLFMAPNPTGAHDGRVLNVIDPGTLDEHPWGGDHFGDPIGDPVMAPVIPGVVPSTIFIRIALIHYWDRGVDFIDHTFVHPATTGSTRPIAPSTTGSNRTSTTTDAGNR
jgi:hypothetical protein